MSPNPAAQSEQKPAPNRHQLRTEATRGALLKSARRIFARDGFEACRIEDIAAATGHTRGAFYAHFRAKEDLFFALLEQEAGVRIKELRVLLAECRTERQKMACLREFFVHHPLDQQWAMLILEFKLFAIRHPKLRANLAATHRRIRASLKKEYGWEIICDEAIKAVLEASLMGLTIERAYDPSRISKEQIAESLGLVFDAMVAGHSRKRRK